MSRGKVTSRLIFRFQDGSIDEDTTVFTQQGVFRLVSDHHIQRGRSFSKPTDFLIKAREESLQTYVQDHIAGAQHAAQLFEALRDLHLGTPLGATASDLLEQVEQDLAVLKSVALGLG